jgi:hypothetical protein
VFELLADDCPQRRHDDARGVLAGDLKRSWQEFPETWALLRRLLSREPERRFGSA